MKEMFKYGLILMVVCVIAAALLSYTYSKTKPVIDKQVQLAAEKTKKEVLPGVVSFKEMTKNGHTFYLGFDEKGDKIGTVIKVATKGYSGTIEIMVGVNNGGTVTGVEILTQTETPGLGAKIQDREFTDQFSNKKAPEIVLEKDSPQGKIDAITAATISSRAVTNEVKKAVELIQKLETK